jgi:hypothetical protein
MGLISDFFPPPGKGANFTLALPIALTRQVESVKSVVSESLNLPASLKFRDAKTLTPLISLTAFDNPTGCL